MGLFISPTLAQQRTVLFSHQSVGRHIIANPTAGTSGDDATLHIRTLFDSEVEFWDHDYSYEGLYNASGDNAAQSEFAWRCGTNPDNDAGCVGMKQLIGDCFRETPIDGYDTSTAAQALAWRDYCSTFDIFIVKPGYRDVHLLDDNELAEYKAFLNVASDWWSANNPGQYFVVMTSSSLRQNSDYSIGTSGFISDASGDEQAARYAAFELWLAKTWVCRNPENRFFANFRKCSNITETGYGINFTKDLYTGIQTPYMQHYILPHQIREFRFYFLYQVVFQLQFQLGDHAYPNQLFC